MSKMKSDPFDVDLFETRLESLKDTQEGIQQMSSWCLQQRAQHKKIVASWLNVFKKVRIEHRLVLFYLANDVIQYSKRKHYEFVESWATALQRATTMVRDEKVKGKILRILNIWEQREIYSDEFISDLHGLLNVNPSKKVSVPSEATEDFQNTTLITRVRDCVELSNATDLSFKKLPKSPCSDADNIKQQLKDKSHSEDVEKEIERYMVYIEMYNKNLQAEIKSRKAVLSSLDTAIKFYSNQRGEVKVVVGAYKNFGSRIKLVKKKLDEMIPNLASPIPSPDVNAPSPEPDADLQLPDEQDTSISVNMFSKSSFNGYSSYLDGNLPFDINDFKRDEGKINTSSSSTASQPIEVIATRPDNQNDSFNTSVEYYKPESISAYPGGSDVEIPGLSPMPVPPVQSEYSSLARSAQQYGIIPAPHPPLFGSNTLNRGYNSLMSGYNENSYHLDNNGRTDSTAGAGTGNGMPLMPPPMPPSTIGGPGIASGGGGVSGGGVVVGQRNTSDDFNSTWDMNMSWSQLDSSNASASTSFNAIETNVSPIAFERKSQNNQNAAVIYTENNLATTQDVDHRRIHLNTVAASLGLKLGLSNEKSRQLDIDHRNLISLTGSPSVNDDPSTTEKKSWLSSDDKDFLTNTGDVDYRGIGQAIKTIDNTPKPKANPISNMEPPPLPPGFLGFGVMESPNKVLSQVEDSVSPKKSNNSTPSESQKDEAGGSIGGGYDPADMVVDMDMSDEDLEDIFREVNEGSQEQLDLSQASAITTDVSTKQPLNIDTSGEDQEQSSLNANIARPPLLETPPEYTAPQNNMWEQTAVQIPTSMDLASPYTGPPMEMENMPEQQEDQHPHPHEAWNHSMPYRGGDGVGPMYPAPHPPHPPFPMHPQHMQQEQQSHFPHLHPQQYPPQFMGGGDLGGGGHGGRGRGRGRAWSHSPQNPFRNAQRPPRVGGSPYFNNRGARGGGMRGPYRGKFRGNNSWM